MKHKDLLKAFKVKAKQIKQRRKDIRFKKTMAFLKGKGLLDTNLPVKAQPSLRLDIQDVLWAGQNVEPRIIEVLPAAVLHFPKNFVGMKKAPKELLETIADIQNGIENGKNLFGLEYAKMKFWANTPMKDKRTRPINERRISKIYRLHPKTLKKLRALVDSGKFRDQTSAIEAAVMSFS